MCAHVAITRMLLDFQKLTCEDPWCLLAALQPVNQFPDGQAQLTAQAQQRWPAGRVTMERILYSTAQAWKSAMGNGGYQARAGMEHGRSPNIYHLKAPGHLQLSIKCVFVCVRVRACYYERPKKKYPK
jgi:hypothetical protein